MAVDLSPFVPGMADNPLPQIILNTIIRTAALMLIAWSLLWWDRKTDPKKVFLWVLGAVFAGVMVVFALSTIAHPTPLVVTLIQVAAEMSVITIMLIAEKMGAKNILTILPAYAIAGWIIGFL